MGVLRGVATLAVVFIVFPLGDLIQRSIVAPYARLRPDRRDVTLRRWIQWCARRTLYGILGRIGGAQFDSIPRVDARPGVLVLMNHQSLVDIPVALTAIRGDYPWIVTRRRYAKRIPLVSHMLRLYDMPLVDPGRRSSAQFADLERRARNATRPLVLFPEGTRSRDGRIRPFKRGGLGVVLRARDWDVYLLVVDGFWRCGRLNDFVRGIGGSKGRFRLVGPVSTEAATIDPEGFAAEMRVRMHETLNEMRVEDDVANAGLDHVHGA